MAKKKSTGMKFELIGGIFLVEEFADGTEKRDEIDGEVVLKLLLQICTDHAERICAEEKGREEVMSQISSDDFAGDSLGDRMKAYESVSRHFLPAKMPVIVRVDGRAFHTYTRGCERPFDLDLMAAMDHVATALVEEMANAVLAYVQSDEISILMVDYKSPETQPWFGGVIQKMVSIAAATAAVKMTMESPKWHPKCLDTMMAYGPQACAFDARAFVVPREDVVNYFIWRQQDWTRNSVQMLARSLYSHKELDGKNQAAMHEMCFQKGQNWAKLSPELKNGRCVVRRPEAFDIPAGPEKGKVITRNRWVVDKEIPVFTRNRGYIEDLL